MIFIKSRGEAYLCAVAQPFVIRASRGALHTSTDRLYGDEMLDVYGLQMVVTVGAACRLVFPPWNDCKARLHGTPPQQEH